MGPSCSVFPSPVRTSILEGLHIWEDISALSQMSLRACCGFPTLLPPPPPTPCSQPPAGAVSLGVFVGHCAPCPLAASLVTGGEGGSDILLLPGYQWAVAVTAPWPPLASQMKSSVVPLWLPSLPLKAEDQEGVVGGAHHLGATGCSAQHPTHLPRISRTGRRAPSLARRLASALT